MGTNTFHGVHSPTRNRQYGSIGQWFSGLKKVNSTWLFKPLTLGSVNKFSHDRRTPCRFFTLARGENTATKIFDPPSDREEWVVQNKGNRVWYDVRLKMTPNSKTNNEQEIRNITWFGLEAIVMDVRQSSWIYGERCWRGETVETEGGRNRCVCVVCCGGRRGFLTILR